MKLDNIEHLSVAELCKRKGLNLTVQRRIIADVINASDDHPNVEKIYKRANKKNKKISLATVYRALKLFEDAQVVIRHEFNYNNNKETPTARYEPVTKWAHNHLVDINTGQVIEFSNPGFANLSKKIASDKGYKVIGYKLELFAVKEACKKFK